MPDLTTEDGVKEFMSQSRDKYDWNTRCDIVKNANNGYPDFWYRSIVLSGLMDATLGQGASSIKIVGIKPEEI